MKQKSRLASCCLASISEDNGENNMNESEKDAQANAAADMTERVYQLQQESRMPSFGDFLTALAGFRHRKLRKRKPHPDQMEIDFVSKSRYEC